MKFWDSSALVPLLVEEATTVRLRDLYVGEPGTIVWWATPVECASAIARLEREGNLPPRAATEAFARLDALGRSWHRIEPVEAVLDTARRLLRAHSLRAGKPSTLELVCLDDRLVIAAQREGFVVRDRL